MFLLAERVPKASTRSANGGSNHAPKGEQPPGAGYDKAERGLEEYVEVDCKPVTPAGPPRYRGKRRGSLVTDRCTRSLRSMCWN